MNDSADMPISSGNAPDGGDILKSASRRLNAALDAIETRIGTLSSRADTQANDVARLSAEIEQAEHFKADRTELAARLDTMTAQARDNEARFTTREREFEALARRTEDEISAIAAQVDAALMGTQPVGSQQGSAS